MNNYLNNNYQHCLYYLQKYFQEGSLLAYELFYKYYQTLTVEEQNIIISELHSLKGRSKTKKWEKAYHE